MSIDARDGQKRGEERGRGNFRNYGEIIPCSVPSQKFIRKGERKGASNRTFFCIPADNGRVSSKPERRGAGQKEEDRTRLMRESQQFRKRKRWKEMIPCWTNSSLLTEVILVGTMKLYQTKPPREGSKLTSVQKLLYENLQWTYTQYVL